MPGFCRPIHILYTCTDLIRKIATYIAIVKVYDIGILRIQIQTTIVSEATLQTPFFKDSDLLSENPGSAPRGSRITIQP